MTIKIDNAGQEAIAAGLTLFLRHADKFSIGHPYMLSAAKDILTVWEQGGGSGGKYTFALVKTEE